MIFIRLMLFGISTIGTFEIIRSISDNRIDMCFLPSLAVAIQVSLLFFAGILNLLPEVSLIIFSVGIIGFVYSCFRNRGFVFIKAYFNFGYLLLTIVMIVMAISVKGQLFSHYDNFSHWAIVVQNMLETNRYPNFESVLILFQNYPLGSATYIYYFASMISTSESVQMLAQIYMIAAASISIFAYNEKKCVDIVVLFLVYINFIFIYIIHVSDLLVDTLLPVIGVCGILFTKKYCLDNPGTDDKNKIITYWLLACYSLLVVQIKNSGIFFVVAILALELYSLKRNGIFCRINGILSMIFPFISVILWQRHCSYVFSSASTSKHAMTIENYKTVLGDKTNEDIRLISTSLFRFIITYKDVWVVLFICIIIGCFVFLFGKTYWFDYKRCLLFSFAMFITYAIGMLGMYLFSMPREEAVELAGHERYLKTLLLSIFMMNVVLFIKVVSDQSIKKRVHYFATISMTVLILVYAYISQGSIILATNTTKTNSERIWIENTVQKYNIPLQGSYCMLIPSVDSGYSYFLQKYIFHSLEVSSLVVKDSGSLDSIKSDYIFVYDKDNKVIDSWIKEHYPEQLGNDVIIVKKYD